MPFRREAWLSSWRPFCAAVGRGARLQYCSSQCNDVMIRPPQRGFNRLRAFRQGTLQAKWKSHAAVFTRKGLSRLSSALRWALPRVTLRPHAEEAAKRPSRSMAAGTLATRQSQWPGRTPAIAFAPTERVQSCGSTLMIAAPWLLPIHSTGRPLVSSTNTRRILVVRGSRYSVNSPLLVLSRETWSFDIDPVHTSAPPLLGTTSYGLPHGVGSLY